MSFIDTFGSRTVLSGPDYVPRTMPDELVASTRINTARSIAVDSITESFNRSTSETTSLASVVSSSLGKGSFFSGTA